jgi:hypothetical protein
MAIDRDMIKKEVEQEYYPAFLMLRKSIEKMVLKTEKVEDLKKAYPEHKKPSEKPKETFDPEGKGMYHIHQGPHRLTDEPVSLKEIRNKYGSVKHFEGLGYRLVPHVQKSEEMEKGPVTSKKPPKDWWDQKHSEVKRGNPDYSDEQIAGTVGKIWSDMGEGQKANRRKAEGKQYGESKAEKVELTDIPEVLEKIYRPFMQSPRLPIGRRRKSLRDIMKRPHRGIVHKEEPGAPAPKPPAGPKMAAPKAKVAAPAKQPKMNMAPKPAMPKPAMAKPGMAKPQMPKAPVPGMMKAELDQDFIPKFYKVEAKLDKEHSEKVVQEKTTKIVNMIKEELKVEFKPKFKLKVINGKVKSQEKAEGKKEDKKDK